MLSIANNTTPTNKKTTKNKPKPALNSPTQSGIFGQIDFDTKSAKFLATGDSISRQYTIDNNDYTVMLYGEVFELDNNAIDNDDMDSLQLILNLYIKSSTKMLDSINGMYSIAIYNSTKQELFLARDRIGCRSLLYTIHDNTILFSSNYDLLFKHGKIKAVLDKNSLLSIFMLGPAHSPSSGVYKNISALQAGHYLSCNNNLAIKVQKYWSLTTSDNLMSLDNAVDTTRELITQSIKLCTKPTMPAIFLSGGLDSSIVASVVANLATECNLELKTYSIDFEDSTRDFLKNTYQPSLDKDYAKIMVDHIKSQHSDIVLSNLDLASNLSRAAIMRGLPGMADVDSSLMLFCEQVKTQHDYALSGECADEIFGGYPWYHNSALREYDGFPWSQSIDMRCDLFKGVDKSIAKEFIHSQYLDTIRDIDYPKDESDGEKRTRQLFVLNLNWFGATLLERKERMSGASNLTVRMPFTDYRLVQWAYNLPWCHKSADGREKGIMRLAFKDVLPQAIHERKKSPFPKTYSPIYLQAILKELNRIIKSNAVIKEILNLDYLNDLINKDPNDTTIIPWYGQLMRLPQVFAYIIQLDALIKEYNITIE